MEDDPWIQRSPGPRPPLHRQGMSDYTRGPRPARLSAEFEPLARSRPPSAYASRPHMPTVRPASFHEYRAPGWDEPERYRTPGWITPERNHRLSRISVYQEAMNTPLPLSPSPSRPGSPTSRPASAHGRHVAIADGYAPERMVYGPRPVTPEANTSRPNSAYLTPAGSGYLSPPYTASRPGSAYVSRDPSLEGLEEELTGGRDPNSKQDQTKSKPAPQRMYTAEPEHVKGRPAGVIPERTGCCCGLCSFTCASRVGMMIGAWLTGTTTLVLVGCTGILAGMCH